MMLVVPEAALRASSSQMGSIWATDFSALTATDLEQMLATLGELSFSTSGTTGNPRTWTRNSTQLMQEARITVEELGHDHDAVYSTVPPESLYGYVAILLAARQRISYTFDRWATRRAPIRGNRPLIFSIPPSWQHLPSTIERFFNVSDESAAVTLVHAGARLPALADRTLQAQKRRGRDIEGIELFGTTETGIVASRKFNTNHEAPWSLVPDVRLIQNTPTSAESNDDSVRPLTVRSPRIGKYLSTTAAPLTITTGDLVTITPDRTMRFVGRASRRAKPGGSWVDLDHLDLQLRELLNHRNFMTAIVSDPLWGEHVELVVDARHEDDAAHLHRMLRHHSDHIDIVPIRVRIAALKWSPMGKARTPTTEISTPGAGFPPSDSDRPPAAQNSLTTPTGRATQ